MVYGVKFTAASSSSEAKSAAKDHTKVQSDLEKFLSRTKVNSWHMILKIINSKATIIHPKWHPKANHGISSEQ